MLAIFLSNFWLDIWDIFDCPYGQAYLLLFFSILTRSVPLLLCQVWVSAPFPNAMPWSNARKRKTAVIFLDMSPKRIPRKNQRCSTFLRKLYVVSELERIPCVETSQLLSPLPSERFVRSHLEKGEAFPTLFPRTCSPILQNPDTITRKRVSNCTQIVTR